MSEERLARMEEMLIGLRTDMADLKAMRGQVEEHHERIYGNGQPGLIKDVDRLKQWRGDLRWIIAAVLIPGVAAAAELVRSLLVSK